MVTAWCGCLNVQVHLKGDQTSRLFMLNNLEPVESKDEFFNKVHTILNPLKITL